MALWIATEIKKMPINFFVLVFNERETLEAWMKIKGLLEPAHSHYGLGLHFLDLLNIGTVEFGM